MNGGQPIRITAEKMNQSVDNLTQAIYGKDLSLKFKDVSFVFSPGKKTYDYSKCNEIRQKEAELKALKQTAQSIGLASQKTGTPYWIVRS